MVAMGARCVELVCQITGFEFEIDMSLGVYAWLMNTVILALVMVILLVHLGSILILIYACSLRR